MYINQVKVEHKYKYESSKKWAPYISSSYMYAEKRLNQARKVYLSEEDTELQKMYQVCIKCLPKYTGRI